MRRLCSAVAHEYARVPTHLRAPTTPGGLRSLAARSALCPGCTRWCALTSMFASLPWLQEEEPEPEKEPEPDFGLSGALAAETNKVK